MFGAMAESADATDLKSVGGDTMRVRPPLAPFLYTSLRPSTADFDAVRLNPPLRMTAMTLLSER